MDKGPSAHSAELEMYFTSSSGVKIHVTCTGGDLHVGFHAQEATVSALRLGQEPLRQRCWSLFVRNYDCKHDVSTHPGFSADIHIAPCSAIIFHRAAPAYW